jgi:trimethylamine:corrinoid methyltransferase-like protein
LMIKPGIKVQNAEARHLLAESGAQVDEETTCMITMASLRSSTEAMRCSSIRVHRESPS